MKAKRIKAQIIEAIAQYPKNTIRVKNILSSRSLKLLASIGSINSHIIVKKETAKTANTNPIKATISKVIFTSFPPQSSDKMSVNFYFTSSDLTNNKLTKYHGFNSVVDVSVFDATGEEVEVSVDVSDPMRVTIDLGRLQVENTWQIKIEK